MNAAKYAYPDPDCSEGLIWVRLVRMKEDSFLVSVHDEGVGVPADYDPTTSKRLGTRLVNALANQLGATLTRPSSVKGTHITLLVPLELPGSH